MKDKDKQNKSKLDKPFSKESAKAKYESLSDEQEKESLKQNEGLVEARIKKALAEGEFDIAVEMYRATIDAGLPSKELYARAHGGLAQALAEQDENEGAIEELLKASELGLNTRSKLNIVQLIRSYHKETRVPACFEGDEMLAAWRQFVLWQDSNAANQIADRFTDANNQSLKSIAEGDEMLTAALENARQDYLAGTSVG